MQTAFPDWKRICELSAPLRTCLFASLCIAYASVSACLPACLRACMRAYVRTFVRA